MAVLPAEDIAFDITLPVVVIGAGACGQVAALTAVDAGVEVLVLERDAVPQGSTALSSGMIPACGTRIQRDKGVDDSVDIMAGDILGKAHSETDEHMVRVVCDESGPAIDWLTQMHGLKLTLVEGFLYPNHSRLRMHAPPSRTGADLIGALSQASAAAGIDIVGDARVADLYADADGRVAGLRYERPDGTSEQVGCATLVLACNGFGGNAELLRRYIPDMEKANYFGHAGNQGDAIIWGEALGGACADLGAFQGHGSVAHPHGILISWALMMEGGIQVNLAGTRFSNEHEGYSEQGRRVMAQPDGLAWTVFDGRLHELGMDFEDFRQAVEAGAVRSANSAAELAAVCGLPEAGFAETLDTVARLAAGEGADEFGRDFTVNEPLSPPYHAIKVTGSLFHTQGGLVVDENARVLKQDGTPLPNLFAGGGAARGVSGPSDWGYLSGNGLLTAVTLGRIAGRSAARLSGS